MICVQIYSFHQKKYKMKNLKKADSLLKTASDVFRVKYPENDLSLIQDKLQECIDIINPLELELIDDGAEHFDNIKELIEIFKIVADHDVKRMKANLLKFIGTLSWENFFDDETEEPYSLGSMFFNKLQWACEHYAFIFDEVTEILGNMLETVPDYLDELEIFANSK